MNWNPFQYIQYRYGNPRPMPRWSGLLNALDELSKIRQMRFDQETPTTASSIRFLRWLTMNVDAESIFTSMSDEDWYERYVLPIYPLIRQFFDPVISYKLFRNVFYRNTPKTTEYLIPITDVDDTIYPFDQPISAWSTLDAVQLLFHTSNELPFFIRNDQMFFRKDPPDLAMIGINIPRLLLQWRSYTRQPATLSYEDTSRFMHSYVIKPFHNQMIDLWVLNLICDTTHEILTQHSYQQTLDKYRVTGIPSNLNLALDELATFIEGMHDHQLKLNDFLVTPLIRGRSLQQWILDMHMNQYVSPLRQYFYLYFLSIHPTLKLLVTLLQQQAELGDNNRMLRQIRLWLTLMSNTQLTHVPGIPSAYSLMKTKHAELLAILKE